MHSLSSPELCYGCVTMPLVVEQARWAFCDWARRMLADRQEIMVARWQHEQQHQRRSRQFCSRAPCRCHSTAAAVSAVAAAAAVAAAVAAAADVDGSGSGVGPGGLRRRGSFGCCVMVCIIYGMLWLLSYPKRLCSAGLACGFCQLRQLTYRTPHCLQEASQE
jgi:hypothetical protein